MFDTPADFRTWLEANGAQAHEVWVGYWKQSSGRRGITYKESVDEALCFGWIDGLTKSVDAARYAIRFTPRRATSNWSRANARRVSELAAEGRMTPAGQLAYDKRRERPPGEDSYETRPADLPNRYAEIFRRNDAAWRFWTAQRPSYRKAMTWWVVSAKREDTRLRRLDALVDESAAGHLVDDLHLPKLGPRQTDAGGS